MSEALIDFKNLSLKLTILFNWRLKKIIIQITNIDKKEDSLLFSFKNLFFLKK